MNWKNKGHVFDQYAVTLLQEFQKRKKVYIFGAGLIGKDIKPVLEKFHCFGGFIDNDEKKIISGIDGANVISLEEYLENEIEGWVVVAADKSNISTIKKQLLKSEMKENEDFFIHNVFMREIVPILSVYAYDLSYVELAQICLTERCSLKCKKCAHGCYAVDQASIDMSFEMACWSADAFFNRVDVVKEFVLIGGEPLLYNNLAEIIEYIGLRYRKKMIIFSITTNGTIIPKQDLLDKCRNYEVLIRVSNYSASLKHLEEKHKLLAEVLENNRVNYVLGNPEQEWWDYGFETVDRNMNKDELIQVFDGCKTPCREVRGSKYYYCVMARSISENLGLGIGLNDYLDLKELNNLEYKKVILEFQMGYSDKGYLDMCNHCNGAGAVNYPIPAAEQV